MNKLLELDIKIEKWIKKNYKLFLIFLFLSGVGLACLQNGLLEVNNSRTWINTSLIYGSILLIIEFAQPKEEK